MRSTELTRCIGRNVGRCRRERRVTAETAAAALGVRLREYEACEAGETRFTSDQIVSICDLLDVMPSRLFHSAP